MHSSALTEASLRAALDVLPPLLADIQTPCDADVAKIDPNNRFLALGDMGRLCIVDIDKHELVAEVELGEVESVSALTFRHDGSLIVASHRFGEAWCAYGLDNSRI